MQELGTSYGYCPVHGDYIVEDLLESEDVDECFYCAYGNWVETVYKELGDNSRTTRKMQGVGLTPHEAYEWLLDERNLLLGQAKSLSQETESQQETIDNLQRQIALMQSKVTELQDTAEQIQKQAQRAISARAEHIIELRQSEYDIDNLKTRLSSAESARAHAENGAANVRKELSKLRKDLDTPKSHRTQQEMTSNIKPTRARRGMDLEVRERALGAPEDDNHEYQEFKFANGARRNQNSGGK